MALPTNHPVPQTEFMTHIKEAMERIPVPEAPFNPYAIPSSAIPLRSAYDFTTGADGSVRFHPDHYETRSAILGGFELTWAYRPKEPARSAFLVGSFATRGGLVARDWFEAPDTQTIHKNHLTLPWANMDAAPSFNRDLNPDEHSLLWEVMGGNATVGEISRLVTRTETELTLLEESRRALRASNDRFRETRRALDEAEYATWRDLR